MRTPNTPTGVQPTDAHLETGQVIDLQERRVHRSRVVCEPLGLRFPTLFRVTIDPSRILDPAARDLIGPGVPPTYTLGQPTAQILKPLRPGCTAVAIDRLDPAIDWLGVTVRHHTSHELAEMYCEAMFDAGLPETRADIVSLEAEIYTVLVHDRPPTGHPAHALCYFATVPTDEGPLLWRHRVSA